MQFANTRPRCATYFTRKKWLRLLCPWHLNSIRDTEIMTKQVITNRACRCKRDHAMLSVCMEGVSIQAPYYPDSNGLTGQYSTRINKIKPKIAALNTKCTWRKPKKHAHGRLRFLPTSLCGVLVFGFALPPASSSRCRPPATHN